jgi:hypothetical protein
VPKYATPKQYKAPLKKRADITAFLEKHKSRSSWPNDYCRFAWDVKLYSLDLTYEHLLTIHKASGYCGLKNIDAPEVQALYQERYAGENLEYLEQMATEDAWRNVNDTDCFNHLWDGTNCKAKFGSYGRSGGYIGLKKFLGYDFTEGDNAYWNAVFGGNPYPKESWDWQVWASDYPEMSYQDLRLLYKFVVQCNHDFTREKACAEVEYQAAYYLFASHEDEIKRQLPAQPPQRVVPQLVLGGSRRMRL